MGTQRNFQGRKRVIISRGGEFGLCQSRAVHRPDKMDMDSNSPQPLFSSAAEGAGPGPLSPAHLVELESAKGRQKKIRRAMTVATVDAWISAIFAGLTLVCSILSPIGLVLGAALAGVAFNSFRAAARLRKFDVAAPRRLAINQLALAAILLTYAGYSLYVAAHAPSPTMAAVGNDPQIAAQLASMMGSLDDLVWLIYLAVYGGLIVGTIAAQGSAALYYYSRGKILAAYLAQTPAWILEVQTRL